MLDDRPPHASARVLCVGADAYLTDLLRYALTREGYAVQVTASRDEAYAIGEHWRPHAAIVDGDPPPLGGQALCAELRGRYGTAAILLTAGAAGARPGPTWRGVHRLSKPFRLHTLLGTIEAALLATAPNP